MKNWLLFFIATVFSTCFLKAQILNSGFENWTTTEPNSWVTTNGLVFLGNAQSVFKSTNAHTDSFACEMRSTIVTHKPSGVFVPDFVGSIFIGKQIGIQSLRGMPYTNKPSNFEFWYKYSTSTGDSATAVIILTKFNTSLQKTDTIAFGYFSNSVNASSYTKAAINLTYLGASSPDTAIIIFSAITSNSKNAGSIFTIDDLAFTGGDVGIAEQKKELDFNLMPNPSIGETFISFNNIQNVISMSIIDLQGKELLNNDYYNQSKISISTNRLKAGIYFVKVSNTTTSNFKKLIVD